MVLSFLYFSYSKKDIIIYRKGLKLFSAYLSLCNHVFNLTNNIIIT